MEREESRTIKLSMLATEAGRCTRCKLHERRTRVVFASGDPYSELVFVGEGPGADEDANGIPFVGASGKLLDNMIAAMGYKRDEVYVCNVVKCRPPENRKPAPEEADACKPYLLGQLELVRPKVIVALGVTAGEALAPVKFGKFGEIRGKVFYVANGAKLVPTFHPAYCLRQKAAKSVVWEDLKNVCSILGRTPVNVGSRKPAETH